MLLSIVIDGVDFGIQATPEILKQQFTPLKPGKTLAVIGRFTVGDKDAAKSPGFAIRNASRIDLVAQ